jgi:hypothetical protein
MPTGCVEGRRSARWSIGQACRCARGCGGVALRPVKVGRFREDPEIIRADDLDCLIETGFLNRERFLFREKSRVGIRRALFERRNLPLDLAILEILVEPESERDGDRDQPPNLRPRNAADRAADFAEYGPGTEFRHGNCEASARHRDTDQSR